MTGVVRYATAGGVATLTMDQPANRNALTPALLNGLGDGLTAAAEDSSIRLILLTNTGPAFCAGADLSAMSSSAPPRFGMVDILIGIQDSPKPVIAKIAGHCMGGGVGLAAACDISIAAESAKFGFTEVRVGVAPAIISVVCLPKLTRAAALELFLTGERITAERAANVGLITSTAPADGLDAAVQATVDKVVAGGPAALAAAKRLVYEVPRMGREEAFEATSAVTSRLFASAEAAEGMAAFRAKRQPSWATSDRRGRG